MLISKNFLTREASYKPSCFTSWIQSGPDGTCLLAVAKQSSYAHTHEANIILSRRFTSQEQVARPRALDSLWSSMSPCSRPAPAPASALTPFWAS
jgi:hypothetical protein